MAPVYREEANTNIRRLGGIWLDDEGQPWCRCSPPEPGIQLTVVKDGPNQGREFWKCEGRDDDDKCNFFAWDDKVEKLKRQHKLGSEFEKPLDPDEIRARASQAATDRAGGQRLDSGPDLIPHTPKKRSHSNRNVASSDDSDEESFGGWDSDDDVELKPASQYKDRAGQGYLATPDTSPDKKKVKHELLEVDLEPQPNPFLTASADAAQADPFVAMLAAVDNAQTERRKFKAHLKAKDMRIKGLEEELEKVKKAGNA